jgi:hypothetical protein
MRVREWVFLAGVSGGCFWRVFLEGFADLRLISLQSVT